MGSGRLKASSKSFSAVKLIVKETCVCLCFTKVVQAVEDVCFAFPCITELLGPYQAQPQLSMRNFLHPGCCSPGCGSSNRSPAFAFVTTDRTLESMILSYFIDAASIFPKMFPWLSIQKSLYDYALQLWLRLVM